jgi:PKHD-type hydroxylase
MSNYSFAPAVSQAHNHTFVSWPNAFTDEELEKILDHLKTLPTQDAVVGGLSDVSPETRKSQIAWLTNNPESSWFYDRMAFVARQLNAKFYNFDLYGFLEDMQFTVYKEDNESHYTWHIDMADQAPAPRKLSLVLQLSDPSEYEGGELQTMTGPTPAAVDKQKGLIAAFPSYVLHRVTPITKGTRYSIVVWVCGPSFK